MKNSKKPAWERVDNGFDLICLNPEMVNINDIKEILQKIGAKYEDHGKTFNKNALKLWEDWIQDISQPLKQAAYCLLSNWFLSNQFAARTSICSGLALLMWHKLFCSIPEIKLTDSEKSEEKVIPEVFEKWWLEQKKCQNDWQKK